MPSMPSVLCRLKVILGEGGGWGGGAVGGMGVGVIMHLFGWFVWLDGCGSQSSTPLSPAPLPSSSR